MDSVLLSSEIEFYVEAMSPQNLTNVGSKQWIEWHKRIQKLNQQALIEASSLREEYVKETLVSFGKVPILIHEAILVNIWKYKVLPEMLKIETNPQNTFIAYSILYHEAICVALLELVLYHASCYETIENCALDLLDYASGVASQLLSIKQKDPESNESNKDELMRQRDNLSFDIGIRSLSIIRYLADNLEKLPLSVSSRIFSTHDIPVLFVELMLCKPWIKENKQYSGGKWMDWDGEALGQAEAQVWLTLRQLLLDPTCQTYYEFTENRRCHILKLLALLNPVILDQLSPLIELKVWISRLSVGQQANTSASSSKPILLESVLEVKEKILKDCGGEWRKIAKDQLPVVFCNDEKVVMENAQMLSEAFNADLLEKFEIKDKANCIQCGNSAIQRCSNCKKSWYCSRTCQLAHWEQHKLECIKQTA